MRDFALVLALLAVVPASAEAACGDPVAPYTVTPALTIEAPLCGFEGDAARGREIVAGRRGNCLACHRAPVPEEGSHGTIGPPLQGVGSRYTAGELRLRLVDPGRIRPDTVMPPFHRVEGLRGVRRDRDGQPILSARQIEDVIAYLLTLTEEAPAE